MENQLPEPPQSARLSSVLAPRPLRLALVAEDPEFAAAVDAAMTKGSRLVQVFDGTVTAAELARVRPNAVVVDLPLLGSRAWSFLQELRDALPDAGVVVCAGQTSPDQRIAGLALGADDWVTKPCVPDEIVARGHAAVRRSWRGSATKGVGVLIEEEPAEVGELLLRPEQLQAFAGTVSAGLTTHQFTLLWVLAEHRGEVLPRARLYELVWGHAMPPKDRGVDKGVSDVRTKLARISPGWQYIHTHARIGYRLEPEPATTDLSA